MDLKSDIGAKAAWKGFSSQTVYIAYRLMILEEKFDIYPENVEDLMIKKDNKVKELIQVKNINTDLTLSHLKPKNNDSFFRRVLEYKSEDVKIKVISFGNIGFELEQVNKKNGEVIKNFKKKMLSYDYTEEEIKWIIEQIEIKKENEELLKEKIFEKLNEDFKTSIAANIIFDCLINYISNLSRKVEMTNSKIWNNKVNDIIKDIISIKGMHEQYGKTILNLSDYKTDKSVEVLTAEYRNGIDANPDHIRNNLDINRKIWIEKIEKAYKNNNIVIIKGLSGQGKSTIAYRFLIDNYNEEFVFVIEHINDYKQAQDIISAISGLARSKTQESIIYIDITPYDTSWKWILDQVQKRYINIRVLITIREEDYNRANINSEKYDLKEIELCLEKEEAQELYDLYKSNDFLDFEDAWERFGKNGPFMEFMYMLNEKQTLTDKISNQINNIIENEQDADNWLKVLMIVSYAGKDNYKIDLEKLSKKINTSNFSKMLKNMEREYLIRTENDSKYIVSTHALRARIICNILIDKICFNKIELIINILECVNEYYPAIIVEFLYENFDKANEFIDEVTKIQYNTWTAYATLIRSMLWLDVYELYKDTKTLIDFGNKNFNDTFINLFLCDITGYLNYNREEHFKTLKLMNKEGVENIEKNINFDEFKLKYKYTDKLLNKIYNDIKNKNITIDEDYSKVGYVLFWMANRQIYLKNVKISELDFSKLDSILDLMIGLKTQCLEKEYYKLLNIVKESIINKYSIISLEESDEITVKFINNITSEAESSKSFFEKIMEVTYRMRALYYDKTKYNVKIIGTDLLEWCTLPDTEKHIASDKLPLNWVTDLNRQLMEMDEFNKRIDSWNSYKRQIDEINELVLEFIAKYSKAMDYFYRNNNLAKLKDAVLDDLRSKIILKNKNMSKNPKCTSNIYGLDNYLISYNIESNNQENKNENGINENRKTKREFDISQKFQKFISNIINFINQRNIAFMSKIKKEENNIINISLFNVYKSLINYMDFYQEYEKKFGKSKINEDLYNELKTFSLFWENFVNQQFMNNKSKLYDIRLMQKKKEENFKNYIESNLEIYEISENNKKYYIVDIFKADEFYHNLYEPFQDKSITSYERFLIEKFQRENNNKIEIVYSIYGKGTLIGSNINLRNILYSKNVEEFTQKQTPQKYDKDNFINTKLIDSKNITYNALLAVGKIQEFKTYYRYIISVNQEINDITKEHKKVYESWCNEIKKLLKEELNELIKSCKIVFKEIYKEEYIEIAKKYIECLVNCTEVLDEIVKEKDIAKLPNLEELTELLIGLFNTLE